MRSTGCLTLIGLAALLAITSGCASLDPRVIVAKRAGTLAGAAVADALPVRPATSTVQKGGNFCDSAKALGAPVPLAGVPRNAASTFALKANEFGVSQGCWPAPK